MNYLLFTILKIRNLLFIEQLISERKVETITKSLEKKTAQLKPKLKYTSNPIIEEEIIKSKYNYFFSSNQLLIKNNIHIFEKKNNEWEHKTLENNLGNFINDALKKTTNKVTSFDVNSQRSHIIVDIVFVSTIYNNETNRT